MSACLLLGSACNFDFDADSGDVELGNDASGGSGVVLHLAEADAGPQVDAAADAQ